MSYTPAGTHEDKAPDHGATIREIFDRVTCVQPRNDNEIDFLQRSISKTVYAMAANESLLNDRTIDAFFAVIESSLAKEMKISALDNMQMLTCRGRDSALETKLKNLIQKEKDGDVLVAIEKKMTLLRALRLRKIYDLVGTLPNPEHR